MRSFIIIILFFVSASSYSQNDDYMLWLKAGAKGKVVKNLSWSGELNGRIGSYGLETFFPQVGLEYKVTKWFRPSIEYRFLIDRNKYGNYKASSRINFNTSFKKSLNDFDFGLRLRYQYAFNSLSAQSYNSDFDKAFRFKGQVDYKIDGTIFSPGMSGEMFFDPQYGPTTPGFTKLRMAIGTKINLTGPNSLSVKYQFDKKFRNDSDGLRHVVSVSYAYRFK
tara:strand:+ start:16387 stop:17052 length:666 start_codon:yes stop_codon:yes gene_type:complete